LGGHEGLPGEVNMPDQVLLVRPEEIIEVEARCSECMNTATYDLFGTKAQETDKCPFCGAEWPLHKAAVTALREGLKVARRPGETIKLRIRGQQAGGELHKRL
jgi:hypothetical protein